MYAKSMIEYARERVVNSAWSQHLGFIPVALALAVASLPFTLERQFAKSSVVGSGTARHNLGASAHGLRMEPSAALENLFAGRVLASVVTAPKRIAMPLDAQQRAVASYVTRKYGVSTEVVQELVRTAFVAGKQFGIDPLLVVAIMAVESSFNPIAESYAGAKGLMQIIPKYHPEKFTDFGGEHTVFDPRVNILVGARIVREYLLMASGDLFTALQTYAGALADRDAAYTNRVLNEKDQLDALAGYPKTDRGNRVVMQIEPQRPGTLVAPRVAESVPLHGPAAPMTAAPLSALPTAPTAAGAPAAPATLPSAPTAPSSKPAEEARHTPPSLPQSPQVQPQPLTPALNLTQALPESVLRF